MRSKEKIKVYQPGCRQAGVYFTSHQAGQAVCYCANFFLLQRVFIQYRTCRRWFADETTTSIPRTNSVENARFGLYR